MKKTVIVISTLMVFLSATFVMADPWDRRGDRQGPPWGMRDFTSSLDLTQEQLEMVRTLRETHIKDTIPIRSKLVAKKAEMKLLWLQKEADANAIKAKQKEIHELMGQMQEKAIDHRISILNTLTPEQRVRVLAGGLERGNKFRGAKGDRFGRGLEKGRCR